MTNEEINALTDPQINLMMALNDESHQWTMDPNNKERHIGQEKDYCNDHAAMMPIVFECGISLSLCRKQSVWFASDDVANPKHSYFDTNPLRAAAIVYLKTKGVL